MAEGPGIYDHECTEMRTLTKADGVLLIVLNGYKGSGVSAQISQGHRKRLAAVLHEIADAIEHMPEGNTSNWDTK